MQQVSKLLHTILSRFRIAPSRTFSDKSKCKATVGSLLSGIKAGPNDMCILNGDNIGFTRKREEASYSQWVLFQDIILPSSCLSELKISPPNLEERLSRIPRHDWVQLCNTEREDPDSRGRLADRVVGIKDHTFDVLTECVLEGIQLVVDPEVNNQIGVGKKIPRAGYIINQATYEQLEEDNHEQNNEQHTSSFYRDNMTLNPVKADLAKKQTTCMIAGYTWRVR